METLLDMLKRHEGKENYPYKCSSEKLSIGYGRNLEDVGISDEEAQILLIHDMENAMRDIQSIFPAHIVAISKIRRMALTDMMFNLGKAGFLTFRKMIDAILSVRKEQDWQKVADEAKDSKWYQQVGVRGTEIVSLLRNGKEEGERSCL